MSTGCKQFISVNAFQYTYYHFYKYNFLFHDKLKLLVVRYRTFNINRYPSWTTNRQRIHYFYSLLLGWKKSLLLIQVLKVYSRSTFIHIEISKPYKNKINTSLPHCALHKTCLVANCYTKELVLETGSLHQNLDTN